MKTEKNANINISCVSVVLGGEMCEQFVSELAEGKNRGNRQKEVNGRTVPAALFSSLNVDMSFMIVTLPDALLYLIMWGVKITGFGIERGQHPGTADRVSG